jgi:hypothetical protein
MSETRDDDTPKALPPPESTPERPAEPQMLMPTLAAEPPDPWDFMQPDDLRNLWNAMVRGGTDGDWRSAEVARRMLRLRQRRMRIALPPLDDAEGIARAQRQLIAETATGLHDPQDAHHLSKMLENRRRALETLELEQELHELNELNAEARRKGGGQP